MSNTTSLLSVNDVSSTLKVSPQYVRRLICEHHLKATRVGRQWVIKPGDVKLYMQNNNMLEPSDHERLSKDLPEIVALSFFSGAMGLDIGMKNGGIQALLACEVDKCCRMTIERNSPEIALIGDINKYSATDILRMAKIPSGRKVDVIFGGPPCQAFSTAGCRRGFADKRGNVFLRYLELVAEIKPSYVVIENVRGLLSAAYPYADIKEPVKGGALMVILERLQQAGYSVSFELYNAANFGAPQIRERVILIGKLGSEKVPHLIPTHAEHKAYNLKEWRTLGEALSGMDNAVQHYIEFPENRLKFYRMLKEGQNWKDLPAALQREAMGAKLELGGGKTGFFRRLNFKRPSPTLVTRPNMPATDLCHPVEDRPLSVEEYARIQEFPDNWHICGSLLDQYRQIGNAVPVKLGEAIARTIIADMKGEHPAPKAGFKYSRYRNTDEISWLQEMNLMLQKTRTTFNQSKEHLPLEPLFD